MSVKRFLVVLICISLITDHVEHLFTSLLTVCLLWRNVCWGPLPILNWVICFFCCCCGFVGVLYILEILTLFQMYHLQIFSPIGCLFIFFNSVLWRTRVGKFCWSSAYVWRFSSVVCAFGVVSQKSLPNPVSWIFLPVFIKKIISFSS